MQCDGVPARSLVFCEILQGVATISGDIVNKRDFTRCAEADGFRIAPTVVRLPRMAASGRLVPTKHLAAGGPALRPMHRSGGMAGVALTVKARPGDNLMLHAAIDRAVPGDVIVVDAGGALDNALMGELMLAYAIKKGVVGFVINGAARCRAPPR